MDPTVLRAVLPSVLRLARSFDKRPLFKAGLKRRITSLYDPLTHSWVPSNVGANKENDGGHELVMSLIGEYFSGGDWYRPNDQTMVAFVKDCFRMRHSCIEAYSDDERLDGAFEALRVLSTVEQSVLKDQPLSYYATPLSPTLAALPQPPSLGVSTPVQSSKTQQLPPSTTSPPTTITNTNTGQPPSHTPATDATGTPTPFPFRGTLHPAPDFKGGSLLVAHPLMGSPGELDSFARSIILMMNQPEGDKTQQHAGLIVNRPTKLTVGNIVPEKFLQVFHNSPIFWGGPVETGVTILHPFAHIPHAHHVGRGLYWGGDEEACQEMVRSGRAQVTDFMFFSGIARWTAGQLEGELHKNWWWQASGSAVVEAVLPPRPDGGRWVESRGQGLPPRVPELAEAGAGAGAEAGAEAGARTGAGAGAGAGEIEGVAEGVEEEERVVLEVWYPEGYEPEGKLDFTQLEEGEEEAGTKKGPDLEDLCGDVGAAGGTAIEDEGNDDDHDGDDDDEDEDNDDGDDDDGEEDDIAVEPSEGTTAVGRKDDDAELMQLLRTKRHKEQIRLASECGRRWGDVLVAMGGEYAEIAMDLHQQNDGMTPPPGSADPPARRS